MDISIEPLRCGTLTAGLSMFEQGATDDSTELPVASWLIRHPDGLVLFDTGMHRDLAGPSELLDLVSLFFEIGLPAEQLIGPQLEARQVDPADIDVVVMSHLHFDHAGGLADIPNAQLIVQQREWEAGFDSDLAAANSFRKEDFDLGHSVVRIDGEHDVFGDGRLVCIPTPGHTPGHQSLRVRLENDEVVLCGDCAYFERTLTGGALPPLSFDAEQQAASIANLNALGRQGARLIPGHDRGVLDALPDRLA